MYSNGCGVPDWTYTGAKHHERVTLFNSLQLIGNYPEMISLLYTYRFAAVEESMRTVLLIWDEKQSLVDSFTILS